jgi:hypothetical protein
MAICELIVHMGALDTVFIVVSVHMSEMEWFTTVHRTLVICDMNLVYSLKVCFPQHSLHAPLHQAYLQAHHF